MTELTSGGPKKDRSRLATVDEWIKLMNRLFDVIDKQLQELERRAERYSRGSNALELQPGDTRALGALSTAISRVRVINEGIDADKATQDNKLKLEASRARQQELERRLARLAESGEDT